MLVFDGAKNIKIKPNESVLNVKGYIMEVLGEQQLRIYNYINPAKDRNFEILEDLTFHKLGIRDVGR